MKKKVADLNLTADFEEYKKRAKDMKRRHNSFLEKSKNEDGETTLPELSTSEEEEINKTYEVNESYDFNQVKN